ncbi:MAG: COX15/CtaA family protein, partial [Trebonia sp.]
MAVGVEWSGHFHAGEVTGREVSSVNMGRVLSRLIAPVWQPTAKSLRGWALAAVISNAIIISSGAAVRLSSSGLGCPDWPTCTQTDASAIAAHAVGQTTLNTWIEFGNRLITFPVAAIAGLTFIAGLRYYLAHGRTRRDLLWLSAFLPLGIIAQAIVGGLVTLSKLNPAMVAAHFLLSTAIILTAAVVLHARTRVLADAAAGLPVPPPARIDLRLLTGLLTAVTAVMLAAGTVVTGTGPLAGTEIDKNGHLTTVPRFHFPLESVTQLHADIGWFIAALAVALVIGLRFAGGSPRTVRLGWIVLAGLGAQGVIGYAQYFNHLPAGLVWVHVSCAVTIWIFVLQLFLSTGTGLPRPTRPSAPGDEQAADGPVAGDPFVDAGPVSDAAKPLR